jgi:hypothetical protein
VEAHLSAKPNWHIESPGRQHKRDVLAAQAEDDRGGLYLNRFGGSFARGGREELTLNFWPRLDPRARAVTLTFSHAAEQVTVAIRLPT